MDQVEEWCPLRRVYVVGGEVHAVLHVRVVASWRGFELRWQPGRATHIWGDCVQVCWRLDRLGDVQCVLCCWIWAHCSPVVGWLRRLRWWEWWECWPGYRCPTGTDGGGGGGARPVKPGWLERRTVCPTSRPHLFNKMKSMSRPFKIKIESIHRSEAQMLDLTVFKGIRWRKTGLLDYVCFIKPTSQHIPLSCRSGHAWNAHVSCPISQLTRFERNCSNKSDASNCKEAFCAALSRSGFGLVPTTIPHVALAVCRVAVGLA